MSEPMPKEFWLVSYGSLVWNRAKLAFVPHSTMSKNSQQEAMRKFWFLSSAEAESQLKELKGLGCIAEAAHFSLEAR